MRPGTGLLLLSIVLAGCASRGGGVAEPVPASVPPPAPPPEAPPAEPARLPAAASDSLRIPRATGIVTAPWDTAARSGDARRAHVYPEGLSALGRKLVDSLPDPDGGSSGDAGRATPATTVPSAGSTPAPAAGAGSDCWRAQLLVTGDAARAERARAEAAALLGVEAGVEPFSGGYRVRAGGCLDAEAALRLVTRARAEAWPEAFRVQAQP